MTSKDKCYRIYELKKLLNYFPGEYSNIIRSGKKSITSVYGVRGWFKRKGKKQRNSSFLLIPKDIQSKDYLLGKWGKQESAE